METLTNREEFAKKVEQYAKENIERAVGGTRCVDGRYSPESGGKIALAGGDLGVVMALLAMSKVAGLKLDAKACFDAVYASLPQGEAFCMHTDDHDHSDGSIGCGHANTAAKEEAVKDYIVPLLKETTDDVESLAREFQAEIKRLIAYSTELQEENIENVVLEGAHAEQGVLVVESEDYTVRHQSESGEQFFVYDETRALRYLKEMYERIAKNLEVRGIVLTGEHRELFFDAFRIQTNATLHHLAKGKEIFKVSIDKNGVVITSPVEVIE